MILLVIKYEESIIYYFLVFLINNGYTQNQIGFLPIGGGINIDEDKTISPYIDINFGYLPIDTYIFNVELGYRLFNGRNNYYFGLSFDIVTDTFLLLAYNYQRRREKK
jgi:hypothetical protein